MPCTPEELQRLAELGADEKVGESQVQNVLQAEDPKGASGAEVRRKMGWLGFARIQRAVFGDEFAAKVMNRLQIGIQQGTNAEGRHFKAWNDAMADAFGGGKISRLIGPTAEQRELISKALEQTDAQGNFRGAPASMPEEIIKAARNLRKIYNDAFKEFGLDPELYINEYAPHRRLKPDGVFWGDQVAEGAEKFRSKLDPAALRFVHELERRGTMTEWDMDAANVFRNYIHAGVRAKQFAPLIDQLEREHVYPFFNVRIVRGHNGQYLTLVNDRAGFESWASLREHVLGVPTQLDRQLAASLKGMTERFGLQGVETRHLQNLSQMVTNLFYGGVLGSPLGTRPASLIRHMFRLTNTYAEFGAKDTLQGMVDAMKPGAWEEVIKRGVVTSPLEGLHARVDLARSTGKIISQTTGAMLKVFDASDRYLRIVAAKAADARFNRAVEEGTIDRLGGGREIRDHVISLVKQGQLDRARDEYAMHNVANTMYVYGKGNRPQMFRGVTGNWLGVLSSYPLNLAEMYIRLGKRAVRGIKDKELAEAMPFIRQVGIVGAGMMAGSQFLNADLSSIFLHGMLPESLPGVSMPVHGYQAGRSNLLWMAGNLFGTGETQLNAAKRKQNNKEVARDLANLVPGGLFYREVGDVLDDNSFENTLKHIGFGPLSTDADRMARERAHRRAQERRLENVPKIRGVEQ